MKNFIKRATGKPSKKISDISKKLNKAFHLVDKKGNSLYNPEPINRWQKRKEVVEKKIAKAEMKSNLGGVSFFIEIKSFVSNEG